MKLSDMLFANAMMGEGGGGGGDSDFSTATVTFINTFEGASAEFGFANATETVTINGKKYSGEIDMLTENAVLLVGDTPTKVMAYSDSAEYGGGWPMIESITATGSITVETDPDTNYPMAVVSGDGTITMNWVNGD